jgi:hypothetical protein
MKVFVIHAWPADAIKSPTYNGSGAEALADNVNATIDSLHRTHGHLVVSDKHCNTSVQGMVMELFSSEAVIVVATRDLMTLVNTEHKDPRRRGGERVELLLNEALCSELRKRTVLLLGDQHVDTPRRWRGV